MEEGLVLSLEWKAEGVIDCESEDGDCDEVICARWGELGGQWTEWGWRNEEGGWLHRWGDAYLKERLVICNEEDTDGRARVTADEERVLPVDWTEIILSNYSGWLLVRTLSVSESWYSVPSLILSQYKDLRMGVIWENLGVLTTVRARQFWMCCGRFIMHLVCTYWRNTNASDVVNDNRVALYTGLTIDTERQKLYYADAAQSNGKVGELATDGDNGTVHRVLISEGGSQPGSVVLDTNNRFHSFHSYFSHSDFHVSWIAYTYHKSEITI